jgi:hypothetical protein
VLRAKIEDSVFAGNRLRVPPYLEDLLDDVKAVESARCGEPAPLGGSFAWTLFGPNEVQGTGVITGDPGLGPFDSVEFEVPPAGATARVITSVLCPSGFELEAILDNLAICTGGSLAVAQQFTANVRTVPAPSPGMGGRLFLGRGDTFYDPIPIDGP